MSERAARFWKRWGRLVVLAAVALGAILLAGGLGLTDVASLERVGRAHEWIAFE